MIKAILIDLDDTLFDNTSQVYEQGKKHSIKAMVDAGFPTSEEDALKLMNEIVADLGPYYNKIIKKMCEKHNVDYEKFHTISKKAYDTTPLPQIKLFDDAKEILEELKKKYKLFLVSTGNTDQQFKKVVMLGIDKCFEEILIDEGSGKKEIFEMILKTYSLKPEECLVVGDRIDSEILAGKELGMKTIWFKHGKYSVLKPIKGFEPDITIKKIKELKNLHNF